eukprot:TRINITY_DN17229_c0_g1_i10.p2 TRINITY_DN17229_c0_g1~~TRINITY_DN17229_c0_g1_i10.p2  ORF type:complete len:114 (+),score=30.34 TRINITY_DN17229_c0_g1_i10:193-534(+)
MSDGKFFTTTKKGEIHELQQELNAQQEEQRKDAVKKVIAGMTVGKDVSVLFQLVSRRQRFIWIRYGSAICHSHGSSQLVEILWCCHTTAAAASYETTVPACQCCCSRTELERV